MARKKTPVNKRTSSASIQGKLNCIPKVNDASKMSVEITGDPEGLRSLAKILKGLADNPSEMVETPPGIACHLHLYPEIDLGWYSCELVLSRADDLDTGEMPEYMEW